MQKILFVLSHLEYGSAATSLGLLAAGLKDQCTLRAVTLASSGPALSLLQSSGLTVEPLSWNRAFDWSPFRQLRDVVASYQPDVIHALGLSGLRAVGLTCRHFAEKLVASSLGPRIQPGLVWGPVDRWLLRRVDQAVFRGEWEAVKSKSMTSEEIHLNAALEAAGIEVTETDLGEFIIQVAGERPSHLVAPAVHHTRESVARVLSKHLGEALPDDPRTLALTGRRVLRKKFFAADLGISGANFAVAETGTLVLVTNEGNGRLTTTWPRVHVAIMGIEKVIPRWEDLPVFLKLLARAATGQTLSVYSTLITGPRKAEERDGPEELHLVILDNGRSKVLATPFRESLQCIRCGACLNACPVYRRIGGHAYGGVYSGPIGSILTPLYDSVRENPHLPHASSLCGACQAACPVKINIPHMLIGLRELQHHGRRHIFEEMAYRVWKMVLQSPWLYRLSLRFARWGLRPLARNGWIRKLPGPGGGWTSARDFPAPAARSFRDQWKELS